jgi:hypothetical protein
MTIKQLTHLTTAEAASYGGISEGEQIHASQSWFATPAEAAAGTVTEKFVNPKALQSALGASVETLTGTALGTTRKIRGEYTLSATGIVSGNPVGVRGALTLTGTVTGGAFLYGLQGKLIVSGTMNHADSRLCGAIAQLDISAGTYTTGQLSCLWVDAGATASASAISTKGGGQFNLIRITNTTAANANAVIYAYAEADFLLDLGGPGGNADWFAAASGTTAGANPYKLKVNMGGVTKYILLADDFTS